MIIPITSEPDWAVFLENLPPWRPSRAPIVVVAPHPDDEILGIGGLVSAQSALGIDVSVVAVTDGEQAYPDDAENSTLGPVRCAEQTAALQRVGVPADRIIRLRLPDSDVSSHIPQLINQLRRLVSKNTHLIAPWRGDFHPDHEACGMAAEQVARDTGASLTSYFFWAWHRGTPALLAGLPLRAFPLTTTILQAKTAALQCHRSQLVRDHGEPVLPEVLLGPARRSAETLLIS